MLNLARVSLLLSVVGGFGCFGNPVGVYRGTQNTITTTAQGSSNSTLLGAIMTVYASAEANQLVVESSGQAFTCARMGDALTFMAGQSSTFSSGATSSVTTLASGTGTLTGTSLNLTLNLNVAQTENGQSGNATYAVSFTGTKI